MSRTAEKPFFPHAVIAILRERFLSRFGTTDSAAVGSVTAGGPDQATSTSKHMDVALANSSRGEHRACGICLPACRPFIKHVLRPVDSCVTCTGSHTEGGTQQHVVEEHKSMYIALCQEAKSLGRAISIHKQVATDVALSSSINRERNQSADVVRAI